MSNAKLRIEDSKVQLEFVSAFNDEVQLSLSPEDAIQIGSLMAEYGKALLLKQCSQKNSIASVGFGGHVFVDGVCECGHGMYGCPVPCSLHGE